jgi:hypothetical protein
MFCRCGVEKERKITRSLPVMTGIYEEPSDSKCQSGVIFGSSARFQVKVEVLNILTHKIAPMLTLGRPKSADLVQALLLVASPCTVCTDKRPRKQKRLIHPEERQKYTARGIRHLMLLRKVLLGHYMDL